MSAKKIYEPFRVNAKGELVMNWKRKQRAPKARALPDSDSDSDSDSDTHAAFLLRQRRKRRKLRKVARNVACPPPHPQRHPKEKVRNWSVCNILQ